MNRQHFVFPISPIFLDCFRTEMKKVEITFFKRILFLPTHNAQENTVFRMRGGCLLEAPADSLQVKIYFTPRETWRTGWSSPRHDPSKVASQCQIADTTLSPPLKGF